MNERVYSYLKKINEMLSSDPLYKNLNRSIDKGDNSYRIIQKRSKKVIDPEWIEVIEDALPNLDNIVRNPRKFIVVEEDIIDISLAKSISKESVKHLATHTNFISAVDGDNVIPSKILNTQKEESYEIYENRFVYTLLKKLSEFINTRYEVIKKSVLNEDQSEIALESKYKVNDSQILFRMNTIANMSFEDVQKLNSEDLDDYERIARIHSIVNGFMSSAFAKEMKSSAPVRPPITHTNVIKKNPDFKKALKIWEFVYSYDKPGFKVEYINESTPISKEIGEEYKGLMFLNHLIVQNLFVKDESEMGFSQTNDGLSEDIAFISKEPEVMCVHPLEIYLYQVQKDMKKVENDVIKQIENNLKKLTKAENINTVKVLQGYFITNKFNALDKKYVTKLYSIVKKLEPDDLANYTLEEIKENYLQRLRDILEKSHKYLNGLVFE